MDNDSKLYHVVLDHIKTVFYPEDWLELDLNFSKTELLILLLVERHGELTMSQMAEAMNMPMSTSTGIADRMVKGKLLKRERSESDRRVVVVCLDEKGKEVISRWKRVLREYLNQIEEALTDEEREVLVKVFIKVLAIVNGKAAKAEGKGQQGPRIEKITIE